MRRFVVVLAAAVAIGTSGCAASRTSTLPTLTFPTLASATATILPTEGGKSADSLLTVHLLRSHQELGAEIRLEGAGFAVPGSSGALPLTLARPSFTTNDLHDGQVRLRLVPERDDDMTFDLQLTMQFSDGSARNFMWRGIRLDYTSPDRVLLLAPARI
jgi:hypothetical protein